LGFLLENCTLEIYNQKVIDNCQSFDCDNQDLNEFFAKDAINYSSELLGKSYCFILDKNPSIIVCAFTISNDSIKVLNLPNSRKKKVNKDIPHSKQMRSYPAVLIGRLGVHKDFRNIEGEDQRIGDQLMDFIKSWFVDGANKTGCRFIVVDAYNSFKPLRYYSNNGFLELFSTDKQEKEYTGIPDDEELATRLLFFDLIVLSQ
jgi:hypothetical protein